jgi:hypothetical protein
MGTWEALPASRREFITLLGDSELMTISNCETAVSPDVPVTLLRADEVIE